MLIFGESYWRNYPRMRIQKKDIDYLLLLVIALIGLMPLILGTGSMKWDTIDLYQPWKYYITESINNGILPLWMPFANSGFAQMSDPGTWYPLSWILGLFGKYGLHMVGIEYVLHLFIAGAGFYKLSQYYGINRRVRILLAVSYMFSGFFVSNAQHNGWINSAAWLPFVFYFFLQLQKRPSFVPAVQLAIVVFLSLSGGYPGIFILTGYTLLFTFAGATLKKIYKENVRAWKKTGIYFSVAVMLFFIFSLPVLISSFEASREITRGSSMPLERVLVGSLTLPSLLSFVFPYTLAKGSEAFFLDNLTILNSFWGFISLLTLVFSLFSKKADRRVYTFAFLGLLFLAIALGKDLPVRRWLYYLLPFMGHTRFPATARIFSILFFLLAAGLGYERLFKDKNQVTAFLKYVLIVSISLFAGLVYLVVATDISHLPLLFEEGFWAFTIKASLTEKILLQGGIFFVEMMILQIFKKYWKTILPAIVILEMVISVQLNMGATIITHKSPFPTDKIINNLPDDYPIPDVNLPQYKTDDDFFRYRLPLIKYNYGIFYKIPSMDGNSPYGYRTYAKAHENGDLKKALNHPLVYFSPATSGVDSAQIQSTIRIEKYNPNEIDLIADMPSKGEIVFLQNKQRHWEATIDGNQAEISPFLTTFMAVSIPAGRHRIRFQYRPKAVIYGFYAGYSLLLLAILFLGLRWVLTRYRKRDFLSVTLVSIALVLTGVFIRKNFAKRKSSDDLYAFIAKEIRELQHEKGNDNVAIMANTDKKTAFANAQYIRNLTECGWCNIDSLLTRFDEPYLVYTAANVVPHQGIFDLIKAKYPTQVYAKKQGNAAVYLFQKESRPHEEQALSFDSLGVQTDSINTMPTAFQLTQNQAFSTARKIVYKNVAGKRLHISFSMKLSNGIAPLFVVQLIKNKKPVFWKGYNLNEYCRSRDEWFDLTYYFDTNEIKTTGGKHTLELLFWNNKKQAFQVRNFKITSID